MPPRGYSRRGMDPKPTIPTLLRKKRSTVSDMIADALRNLSDPDNSVISETLKKQTIPAGWEAAPEIPDWARRSDGVRNEYLQHALRLPGTNHILTSGTKLTDKQLESLTADYKKAIDAAGHMFPNGIAMYVPAPNGYTPRRAHGWMEMTNGKKRVFCLRPSIAKNAGEEKQRANLKAYREKAYRTAQFMNTHRGHNSTLGQELPSQDAATFGHLMPAAEKAGYRTYVMLHEMGHNHDDVHRNTGGLLASAPGAGGGFWKIQKRGLSRYGQSSAVEGYAEAFAQYFLGGRGSNKAADRYASVYNWVTVTPVLQEELL